MNISPWCLFLIIAMAFVVAWICQRLLAIFDSPLVLIMSLVVALLMARIMFGKWRSGKNAKN